MGFNIRHLNKYFRWLKNEREAYKKYLLVDKEYARLSRALDIALLRGKKVDEKATAKHEWVLNYIADKCSETIEKYRAMPAPTDLAQPNPELKVWSMWWQGEENAGPMFRMCIDSARRHTHLPVVTLDQYNYRNYFEIPDYILQKQAEGKIALQHICDLMVMSIMAAEGGFFTGATVWLSQDVPEEILRAPYWTCRAVTDSKVNMSRSRWVGYVMSGKKDFPLYAFVRDCLHEYWRKCDIAVDYLMMDYIYELAYRNIPCVRETIDALPAQNNMLRNELIDHLSDEYDPKKFRRYTEGDTIMYKLSWKFGRKDEKTADGKLTNYGAMLTGI